MRPRTIWRKRPWSWSIFSDASLISLAGSNVPSVPVNGAEPEPEPIFSHVAGSTPWPTHSFHEYEAAREDTVLFPTFRALLSERELKKLMDVFEDKEKALPHGGFEKMVDEVAKIEQSIDLYDLAKFTPG